MIKKGFSEDGFKRGELKGKRTAGDDKDSYKTGQNPRSLLRLPYHSLITHTYGGRGRAGAGAGAGQGQSAQSPNCEDQAINFLEV